jgi:hypothetical protein
MTTDAPQTRMPRSPAIAPALLAAMGVALYASIFFPGALGFDGAYQWWQARGGETTNLHGVAMTWLWRVSDHLAIGPGPLFVLQLALFWSGIWLTALTLYERWLPRLLLMLVVGFAPVCFVLFSFVANDVMFIAALSLALGISLHARGRLRGMGLILVVALLFLAYLLRKNAFPAVFPLLVYIFLFVWRGSYSLRLPRNLLLLAIGVVLAMQAGSLLLDRTVDRRLTIFAGTTLWDLSAISLGANEILLPSSTYGPGLTVDDLRGAFVPYANTTIFERTHAGMRQPFLDPADPRNGEIWQAWIAAVLNHPGIYLAHRFRLSLALFGSKRREWPRELVYFAGENQYRDNPPVQPNTSAAHELLMRAFEAARSTVVLAAWPYIAVALVSLARAWRRRREWHGQAALAILASGLMYALPLPIIAPSAELRYLGWTCVSAILGAALAFASPRSPVTPVSCT